MLAGQRYTLKMASKTKQPNAQHNKAVSPTYRIRNRSTTTNRTHIILILLAVIIIINKANEVTKTKPSSNIRTQLHTKHKLQYIQGIQMTLNLLKRKHLMKKPTSMQKIVILLILLSNDVNPNPGPKPSNPVKEKCSLCTKQTHEEDSMQCNTCNKLLLTIRG